MVAKIPVELLRWNGNSAEKRTSLIMVVKNLSVSSLCKKDSRLEMVMNIAWSKESLSEI